MITIGFKEILIILGIVAFMIWLKMFRTSMEQNTTQFFKKLKAPAEGGSGFGWRGLLIAFLVGIGVCIGFAVVVIRLWNFYHPVGTTGG